jgi:hypothetical protein
MNGKNISQPLMIQSFIGMVVRHPEGTNDEYNPAYLAVDRRI